MTAKFDKYVKDLESTENPEYIAEFKGEFGDKEWIHNVLSGRISEILYEAFEKIGKEFKDKDVPNETMELSIESYIDQSEFDSDIREGIFEAYNA